MFGFLKKKLQESVEKISTALKGTKEENAEEHLAEQIETAKPEPMVEVPKEDVVLEEEQVKEEVPQEVPIEVKKEIEQEVTIEAKEHEKEKPKKGLFEKIGIKKKPKVEIQTEKPKGIIEKIKKAVTEKTIEEADVIPLLEDLQTALMESDVAFEVSEKITNDLKDALVGKSVPRGKAGEIVKDSLRKSITEILSVEKVDIVKMAKEKKPLKIIFLGFNGTGKCVSGDTMIPLTNGEIVSMENLYDRTKLTGVETVVDDGCIINGSTLEVFSVNPYTLKIERVKAERIWKLRKEKLLRIVLENGQEIKVTPEHPFFCLKSGGIMQKKADKISTEDYVMIPKTLHPDGYIQTKFELLKKIENRKVFICSKTVVSEAYKEMKKVFGSLNKAFCELAPEAHMDTFKYHWTNANILPITVAFNLAEKSNRFAQILSDEKLYIKLGRGRPMPLPDMNSDFYEWLGLFYSEGHLDKGYIDFTNSEDWLLERFLGLTKRVFGIRAVVRPDYRNPKVRRVIISNNMLCYFLQKVVGIPRYKKSSNMELPEWILRSPENLVAQLLKAYWEGDGHVQTGHRALEAATASKKFAKQLSSLLLRFGIIASMSRKRIEGKYYYRIYIVGKGKLKTFYQKIGFLGFEKMHKLEIAISMPSQYEKTELIPMQADYLRNLRMSTGILQQELAGLLGIGQSLLSQYERSAYQVAIPVERIAELASKLSSPFLNTLANADVRWIKVRTVENIIDSEQWVYDFTIPAYHNFVANNFIVHNTTTVARLGYLLKQEKLKPIFAAADTWRAAAQEQLEIHGEKLGIDVIKHKYGADPAAVIFDAVKAAESRKCDVVLADTAGRAHSNKNLMDEMKKIVRVNKPDLKILVVDSLTGNDAVEQAKLFDEAVGVDGIVMTKADVYDKGGALLSAVWTIKKPILYVGTGQDYKDLKEFKTEEIVKSLLG